MRRLIEAFCRSTVENPSVIRDFFVVTESRPRWRAVLSAPAVPDDLRRLFSLSLWTLVLVLTDFDGEQIRAAIGPRFPLSTRERHQFPSVLLQRLGHLFVFEINGLRAARQRLRTRR